MKFQKILITGGAGFIGSNAASAYLHSGKDVMVLDNFARGGTEKNADWLKSLTAPGKLSIEKGDIRDWARVQEVFSKFRPEAVIHLAAQVAVTTSVTDPRTDLETNIVGTFNVLEATRKFSPEAAFINASTNKVYGHLDFLPIQEDQTRYQLTSGQGVTETMQLDFYSPYGCSKGAGDQYSVDYARIYNLNTVTLRQSCIYGYRQFGVEDQGWVAWFIIAHILKKPITVYGNGKQVRDLLFIDDLIDCYSQMIAKIDSVKGTAFNIGGGMQNSISLLEFFSLLEEISGKKINYAKGDWRPGDQPLYISDNSLAEKKTGWKPTTSMKTGIEKLYKWVFDHQDLFRHL